MMTLHDEFDPTVAFKIDDPTDFIPTADYTEREWIHLKINQIYDLIIHDNDACQKNQCTGWLFVAGVLFTGSRPDYQVDDQEYHAILSFHMNNDNGMLLANTRGCTMLLKERADDEDDF